MVEILGVLAIMGLLGITGIIVYQNAMDIYRANETIREVNQRSLIYSQQILHGSTALSSVEFDLKNETILGYPLEATLIPNQPYFKVELKSVPKGVCEKIVNDDWTLPVALYVNGVADRGDGVDCPIKKNTMAFYFQRDLAENNLFESSDSGYIPEETEIYLCRSNSHCRYLAPVCDRDTGICGPCQTNNDCSLWPRYSVCNTETGACGRCQTDEDCANIAGKPFCRTFFSAVSNVLTI